MKKKLVNNTVIALVALAMVFGLCFAIGEQIANADISGVAIKPPAKLELAVGETLVLEPQLTGAASGGVTYLWESATPAAIDFLGTQTPGQATTENVTVKGLAIGTSEIKLTVTDVAASGATYEATITLEVKPFAVAALNINALETRTPTVTFAVGGAYTLAAPADPTVASIINGNQVMGKKAGSTTITATSGTQTATFTVTVGLIPTTLSITTPSGATAASPYRMNVNGSFKALISTNSNSTVTWTSDEPTFVQVSAPGTTSKEATITGKAVTATPVRVTVSLAGNEVYGPATAEFYVMVGTAGTVTATPSTIAMALGGNTTIAATVTNGGDLVAYSSNDSVVQVVSVPSATSGNILLSATGTGSAVITVSGTTTGTTKTVIVNVGNVKPVTTLSFNPDETKLGSGESIQMTIHVDNPVVRSDGNYYVKIAPNSRRVTISNYNYSKVSDYEYWVRLDSSGNATVTIKPQYNGTAKVTVTADSASAVSRTFTITGYPTLPQTGQDFTLLYVLGACCLLAAGTWVVLYARKKKLSRAA